MSGGFVDRGEQREAGGVERGEGILGDSGRVESLDIVEINPILDKMNQTAELAVELAASLLGQQIL